MKYPHEGNPVEYLDGVLGRGENQRLGDRKEHVCSGNSKTVQCG